MSDNQIELGAQTQEIELSDFLPKKKASELMRVLGFVKGEREGNYKDKYVLDLFGLSAEEYAGTEKQRRETRRFPNQHHRVSRYDGIAEEAHNSLAEAVADINDLRQHYPLEFPYQLIDVKGFDGGYGLIVEQDKIAHFAQIPAARAFSYHTE